VCDNEKKLKKKETNWERTHITDVCLLFVLIDIYSIYTSLIEKRMRHIKFKVHSSIAAITVFTNASFFLQTGERKMSLLILLVFSKANVNHFSIFKKSLFIFITREEENAFLSIFKEEKKKKSVNSFKENNIIFFFKYKSNKKFKLKTLEKRETKENKSVSSRHIDTITLQFTSSTLLQSFSQQHHMSSNTRTHTAK
jgi:hypothetical protein